MAEPATAVLESPQHDAPAPVRPLARGWIHLVAGAAMVVAGPLLVVQGRGAAAKTALGVYVLSMLALFWVSASFHRIRWQPAARRRMRRADHATIFVGIAGTYTAVAVLVLHGWAQVLVLCLVWLGGGVGVTLRQVWLDAPKWAVSLPYVVVGWCALAVVPQLVRGLTGGGFALVLVGGAAYTIGAVVYAARRPDPWPRVFGYHEIFHACTVVGATLHYAAISLYAVPAH